MPTEAKTPFAGGLCNLMVPPPRRRNCISTRSTESLKWHKKSVPTSGNATAALRNDHLKARPATEMTRSSRPQQAMGLPSAAAILGPDGGDEDL